MSSNLNATQFRCPTCNKILSTKQNLKQHQNIHTGQTPFHCDFPGCESKYRHASQLSNHKLLHKPPEKSRKDMFYDFKTFIMLVLEALDRQEKMIRSGEKKSFSQEKIILPLISSYKVDTKIPLAEDLKVWNN